MDATTMVIAYIEEIANAHFGRGKTSTRFAYRDLMHTIAHMNYPPSLPREFWNQEDEHSGVWNDIISSLKTRNPGWTFEWIMEDADAWGNKVPTKFLKVSKKEA